MKSLLTCLTVAMVATGCTTLAPPPMVPQPASSTQASVLAPARWSGHISLRLSPFGEDGPRGVSLSFPLQGQPSQGGLDLSTPLGTLVASVRWSPGQAVLHTTEGIDTYASLDELIARVLGEPLPVQALMSWLTGQPDAELAATPLPAIPPSSSSPGFEQAGWRVDTSALSEGVLSAQRPASSTVRGATLRLRLER